MIERQKEGHEKKRGRKRKKTNDNEDTEKEMSLREKETRSFRPKPSLPEEGCLFEKDGLLGQTSLSLL
jgi:hypothetical protein